MPSIRANSANFNLSSTVESGQIFRWRKEGNGYAICHRDKRFFVAQKGNQLEFRGVSAAFVQHFFGLDLNYAKIKQQLLCDKALAPAIRAHPGIHLIRQEPWECTVSFICSQFSNIKKIQLNLRKIVDCFGAKGSFPSSAAINDHAKLRNCGTGFRAKYIFETSKRVSDKFFAEIAQKSYEEAKTELMTLPGVGEKVADCICLFSLGFTEAFPVDVWIKRAMEELYFGAEKRKEKKIREFAGQHWGKLAGYAQQYLYHWRRLR